MLFIDEAYALTPGGSHNSYGPEAIAELLRLMEDTETDLVVIAAGVRQQDEGLLAANPGLASRFPTTVRFPDYSEDELVAIFESMASAAGLVLSGDAREEVRRALAGDSPRRVLRQRPASCATCIDRATALQAERVLALPNPTSEEIRALLPSDIVASPSHTPEEGGTGQYL
ncbi:hypothetical protein [Nonomuraea dietziae]|uniref:hypothetical protein n=1 Tax=Nonomuraea dietziae TaxID=65515 RepID=UPI0031DE297F